MKLKIGDKAPAFTLKNQEDQSVSLKDFIGKNLVLLAFYPGDFTSVCTSEMVCFREDFSEFKNLDCVILGISCDSVEKHFEFKKKFGFPFDLLSDPDAAVAKAYDVKLPLVTKANRAIFIIALDGKIGYAYKETLPVFKRANQELLVALKEIRQK